MGRTPERQSSGKIAVALMSDTVGLDAGTERQVVETAKRLDQNRFEVHVVCLEDSPQLRSVPAPSHTVVFPTKSVNSVEGLKQVRAFRRYADEHGIQIAHGYMNKTSLFAVLSSLGTDRIAITSRLNTGYWYTPRAAQNVSPDEPSRRRHHGQLARSKTDRRGDRGARSRAREGRLPGRGHVEVQPGLGDPAAAEKLGFRQMPVWWAL